MSTESFEVEGVKIENLHVGEDGSVAADITYDEEKITEKQAEEIFSRIINEAIRNAVYDAE